MKKIAWLFPLLFAGPLFAQTDALQGYCDRGGTHSLVSGLPATNWQLGNIPGCTVSVYFTGTTTLVTGLTADKLGTPLSNPFTATTATSPNPGYWIFFAPIGVGYDVTMKGGGGVPTCTTQPNCYAIPITKTDLKVGGSGGGGSGVTSVSCDPAMGNLLGCTVTNPGTTPGFHWTLNNQAAQTIYGNFTGGSRGPFFAVYSCTGLLTCNFDTPSNTWTLNVPIASSLSITATTPIRVNGGDGPVSSGTANITCPTCGAVNTTTAVTLPAGNYIAIYPHRFTITREDYPPPSLVGTADGQNASATFLFGSTCSLSYTDIGTWDQYSLADVGLTAADVIDVQAFGVSSITGIDTNNFCYPTLADPTFASTTLFSGTAALALPSSRPVPATQTTGATGFTGAQVATATTVAQMTVTGATRLNTQFNILSTGLIIHYSGTHIPVPNRLYVRPPLGYDLTTQSIFLDGSFPQQLNGYVIGTEPYAGNFYNATILITGSLDCVTPSANGNDEVLCKPKNTTGSLFVWEPINGGGGTTSTYFTETLTCASTCTLTHTPTTFDNLSVNGLVMINGTDFTRSGTTVTLATPAVGGDVYYAQYHY